MREKILNIYKDNWEKFYNLGFFPYPGARDGKNPIVKWKDDLPTLDLLKKWANQYPDKNLWVRLGDKYAVIDPDGPGAEEFVRSLNLPPCPTSISGNKSIHRWFKVTTSIKPVKATNGGDETYLELRTGSMGMLAPPEHSPRNRESLQMA